MKRQVLLLLILGIISLTARGQCPVKGTDVQGDTVTRSEQKKTDRKRPVNDYSGLNSLRARLANRSWDGHSDTTKIQNADEDGKIASENKPSAAGQSASRELERRGEESTGNRYFDKVVSEGIPIGIPVLVFFKGGGTELTDPAQMINLRNAAHLAKVYGFRIRVTSSADSATGTAERNETVARRRGKFIGNMLVKEGLPEDCIVIQSVGGVDSYSPPSANRNCTVELLF